jgi:hypothetical protein
MSFEPEIVGFMSNWCFYAAANLAAKSWKKHAFMLRLIGWRHLTHRPLLSSEWSYCSPDAFIGLLVGRPAKHKCWLIVDSLGIFVSREHALQRKSARQHMW